MRRNPLLMTVMGNPGGPSFIVIDSTTGQVMYTKRATGMGNEAINACVAKAHQLADRTGRSYIVFLDLSRRRVGDSVDVRWVRIMGITDEVHPERRSNPGFFPSVAGGIAGTIVANALSNPRRAQDPDPIAARELELYIENDSDLYHRYFVPMVKNLMKKRSKGIYNSEKAAKLFLYLADAGAKKYYKEFSTSDSTFRFDLATRWAVAKSIRDSFETEANLGNYGKMTWGVSNNPHHRSGLRPRGAKTYCSMCGQWEKSKGPYHTMKVGPSKGKVICDLCYRGIRSGRRSGESWARNPAANPGPGRKVTMPIAKFANLVKARRDSALWRDFVAKCKAYHKWSHGTWPTKVTVETVKKPGMNGLWITFDMGKEPEKTYVMPRGTKRKGAWKHPWERMPELRGDAEAGFILTKLGGKNRLTDFLHG